MTLLPNKYFIPDDFFEQKEFVAGTFSFPTQQNMIKTQQQLTKNLCSVETEKNSISLPPNYDELLQPSKVVQQKKFTNLAVNTPELDEILQELDYISYIKKDGQTNENYHKILTITEYILQHYMKVLSRTEYIHVMLTKALAYHQLKDYIQTQNQLKRIEPYIKYFDTEQLVGFYDFMGNVFLEAGKATGNTIFLEKSLDAFKKNIDNANECAQLTPDVYQRTQYKIGKILLCIHKESDAITIFEEITTMADALFMDDDIATRTNKELKKNSYHILGTIFEQQKKHDKAIAAYIKYLNYNPNDEYIKTKITLLSK